MPLDDAFPSGIPRSAWFVVGPTASGKTALGIELARRVSGEILSLDSMALYRGLDIGTAKPIAAEQAAAPHHLIDLLPPSEEFSVADYLHAARDAANAISARGREVILVGGTPLYLKALLRGMFEGPPADWEFRRAWEARAAEQEPEWLHAQLAAVDPVAAAKLHANDSRRIVRALEVLAKTGTPMSSWQQQFNRPQPRETCRVYVLHWPRETLYRRINERVVAMFDAGLVAEVESLLASGATFGRTAAQALGYREVLEHLRGEHDLATTIELVQNRTRAFARRQLTWFRSLQECRWVELSDGGDAQDWARKIADEHKS